MIRLRPSAGLQRSGAVLLLSLVSVSPLVAAEDTVGGEIRLGTDADSPVWAGEQVTLNLDLMSTGFSFSGQHFLLPEVEGGFLLQTDSTTVKLTEQRGGETWQVLRYPIALFPQRAGSITVPAFEVRFRASAGYGKTPQQFAYRTQPVTLQVERPPGLDGDGVVVTTEALDVDAAWVPPLGADTSAVVAARAGDAVSLTVTLRAANVSGMFLPQLPVATAPGLSAYPEPPVVTDRVERGRLEGSRVEAVTWVFVQPGRYELPEIRYRWFDPQAREVRERLLPGRRFEVAAGPELASAAGAAAPDRRCGRFRVLLAGAAAILVAGLLFLGSRRDWRHAWRRSWDRKARAGAANERELYRRALKACRAGEAATAYAALLAWAARREGRPVALGDFAGACEPAFRAEVEALQRSMISGDGHARWNGTALVAKLRAQRRLRASLGGTRHALAPLNPTSALSERSSAEGKR